jgi:hypothetical protein
MAYAIGIVIAAAILVGIYELHLRLNRRTVRDWNERLGICRRRRGR